MIQAVYGDNVWAVIPVTDWLKLPKGTPRSKTFRDAKECFQNATWDPSLTLTPGPGSLKSFVKVSMPTLQAYNAMQTALPTTKGGLGKVIPDYPHKCHACGGKVLQLFTSIEHEGGVCPATAKR